MKECFFSFISSMVDRTARHDGTMVAQRSGLLEGLLKLQLEPDWS